MNNRKISEFLRSVDRLNDVSKKRLILELEDRERQWDEAYRLLGLSLLYIDKESDIYGPISNFLMRNKDEEV